MELHGEQQIPLSISQVWSGLMNTDILRRAIPGCEAIEIGADGKYLVTVVASIGPVKARFKGSLQQTIVEQGRAYDIAFEGNGGMAGFAKGTASVTLTSAEDDGTVLRYRAHADIGGRLAQIGSRLVDAAAAHMSAQFFERLVEAIRNPAAEPAEAPVKARAVSAAGGVHAGAVAVPAGSGLVTIQMPAWAWAFTVTAIVLGVVGGYLASH